MRQEGSRQKLRRWMHAQFVLQVSASTRLLYLQPAPCNKPSIRYLPPSLPAWPPSPSPPAAARPRAQRWPGRPASAKRGRSGVGVVLHPIANSTASGKQSSVLAFQPSWRPCSIHAAATSKHRSSTASLATPATADAAAAAPTARQRLPPTHPPPTPSGSPAPPCT